MLLWVVVRRGTIFSPGLNRMMLGGHVGTVMRNLSCQMAARLITGPWSTTSSFPSGPRHDAVRLGLGWGGQVGARSSLFLRDRADGPDEAKHDRRWTLTRTDPDARGDDGAMF